MGLTTLLLQCLLAVLKGVINVSEVMEIEETPVCLPGLKRRAQLPSCHLVSSEQQACGPNGVFRRVSGMFTVHGTSKYFAADSLNQLSL